jgi:glycosyltransferase involved in cell wall biosynthesis
MSDRADRREIVVMYVGNLETYQGVDLLLESFALVWRQTQDVRLVIIGGTADHIESYQRKSVELGIDEGVDFLGPRPVNRLSEFLSKADILVCPRTKGINTPMKLFSYLHSAKPVLATNLPTHTQVLNSDIAMLADPSPEPFAEALMLLLKDEQRRLELGRSAREFIEARHTYKVFREELNRLFDWLQFEVAGPQEVLGRSASGAGSGDAGRAGN